ncbi:MULTISPECIES: EamA family transporter [Micromonospora]|uniref:EamA family transporter n=1 Tax=Micromonospora TaxID=1873 RepID=UPI000A96325E|nr:MULTISPECIES: EamA family transporter [Micromonospora]MCK1804803.1 EamA family transporter [Micromonospora sp. R42106]MCK1834139.1 EamA family transporter [Micromonospora sp. R42003]MCK1842283.1 EamA family transporter [Micromonospora sp. R42004]MCM1018283.1 EamA family transporter [Micromonospora sp. XM-20-01]WDP98314.1 EamA family transporter [Micromonospora chalcea]
MSSRPTSATNAVDSATPPTRTALIWTALVLVYLLWGSTYLGIRVAVESLPPLISAAMRFAGAAVVLAVVLRLRRGPGALRVPVRRVGSAALIGVLLLAGGNGLVVLAESGPAGTAVPSGVAALLVATVPLLVVVLRTVGGDRPRPWTFLGVALGFAGLVVLVLPRDGVDGVPVAGALTVVAAATSWSVGSYLSGRIRMPADPFVATVYEMLAGAAVLALVGVARGELRGFSFAEVTGRSWAALAYLMVAGSLVAFTAYVWLLAHAPISLVSTYAYVNPVVAVALGALFVAEPITSQVLLGGAIIVVGVAVVVSTERPRRSPPPAVDGAAGEPAGR